MPEYVDPGVYVEEVSFRSRSIDGVDTSTAGFVGAAHAGPTDHPVLVTSLTEFERTYGGGSQLAFAGERARAHNLLWHSVWAFFAQGGRRLWVQRAAGRGGRRPGAAAFRAALQRLAPVEVALVAAPGGPIGKALAAHAERLRDRVALLDAPEGQPAGRAAAPGGTVDSPYAALHHPWLRVPDPVTGREIALPPSGFVAGMYARNDLVRGVHTVPANVAVAGATGLASTPTGGDLDVLAARRVNSFRVDANGRLLLWGARTTSSDPEWKYVNVRRYLIYLEHSIDRGTQWAVFEPNDERLWARLRSAISDFLIAELRRGALVGSKPEEAFFVHCDRSTMTQNDLDNGRLVCLVGVAVVRPAEFVLFRIGRWTADHRDS